MTKRNRVISMLLVVTVLFVMLFSASYMAVKANHDCIGEGCTVCHQMDLCKNFQKNLAAALLLAAIVGLLSFALICCVSLGHKTKVQDTLITLKVELLN